MARQEHPCHKHCWKPPQKAAPATSLWLHGPGSYLSAVEAQQDVHLQRGHVEDAVSEAQLSVAQPRPLQPPGPCTPPAQPALACQGSVSLAGTPGAPAPPAESPDPTSTALTVLPEGRELIQRGAQCRREEPPGLLHVARQGHGPAARGQHQHLHLRRICHGGLPWSLGTEGGSGRAQDPTRTGQPPALCPSPQPQGSQHPDRTPAAAGLAPAAGRGGRAAAAPPTPPGHSASPGGSGGGSTAPSAPPRPLPARRAPAPAAGPPGTACHSHG